MTVPDPDPAPESGSRFPGDGFRVEPDFRYPSGEAEYVPDRTARQPALDSTNPQPAISAAELDDVFDDPEHGEPGRDRLGVHWVWETLLLIACVAIALVTANTGSHAFSDASLRSLLLSASVLGGSALAAGMSLRVGAINLAIGPIMVLSALYFADHVRDGFVPAFAAAAAIATAIGAVIGLVVIGLQVPAWTVSLGAFVGLQLWIRHLPLDVQILTQYHVEGHAYLWFAAFAALALIGGVLGAIHPIRRAVGRFRPIADPADRRGIAANVVTVLMLAGSGLMAGLAGVATALMRQEALTGTGMLATALAIGVALAAGTSAFGRRGGVLGVILATSLVSLLLHYFDVAKLNVDPLAVAAAAIIIGIVMTRVVESSGRPQRAETTDDTTSSWLRRQQGSWTDQLPARTTDAGFDSTDERWGSRA